MVPPHVRKVLAVTPGPASSARYAFTSVEVTSATSPARLVAEQVLAAELVALVHDAGELLVLEEHRVLEAALAGEVEEQHVADHLDVVAA